MQKKHNRFLRNIKIAFLLISFALVFGIVGFIVIEGYTFSEAFYSTIIVLSTVGLGVAHDLSEAGRWFVCGLIVISIGVFAYGISTLTTYVMEGELQKFYKNKRASKMIDKMNNHVIVCGYGRNGKQACEQLTSHGQSFIVIDNGEVALSELKEQDDFYFIEGDATRDEILIESGISKARAIITTLPNDAANVFVVLTARELNPSLKIISRASEDTSEGKLRRAGADNVIMPDKIGGTHMATLVTRPDVLEFLDYITGTINVRLEEIYCSRLKEEYKGKSIRELEVRNKSGANIIGFKNNEGVYTINPDPDTIMEEDSKVFVLGTKQQIKNLMDILI
jgi:voltage-gated potassium channel